MSKFRITLQTVALSALSIQCVYGATYCLQGPQGQKDVRCGLEQSACRDFANENGGYCAPEGTTQGSPATGTGKCLWIFVESSANWMQVDCFSSSKECQKASTRYESKKECRLELKKSSSAGKKTAYYFAVDYKQVTDDESTQISRPESFATKTCELAVLGDSDAFSYFSAIGIKQGFNYLSPTESKEMQAACKQNYENDGSVYCRKNEKGERYYKYFDSKTQCVAGMKVIQDYMHSVVKSEKPKIGPTAPLHIRAEKEFAVSSLVVSYQQFEKYMELLSSLEPQASKMNMGDLQELKLVLKDARVSETNTRKVGMNLQDIDKQSDTLTLMEVEVSTRLLLGERKFKDAIVALEKNRKKLDQISPGYTDNMISQINALQ